MNKTNKIRERSLRSLLKYYKDDFQDLLRSSGDILIHQRCINFFLIEVYKYIHGLSPKIINDGFSTRPYTYCHVLTIQCFRNSHTYLQQI